MEISNKRRFLFASEFWLYVFVLLANVKLLYVVSQPLWICWSIVFLTCSYLISRSLFKKNSIELLYKSYATSELYCAAAGSFSVALTIAKGVEKEVVIFCVTLIVSIFILCRGYTKGDGRFKKTMP